MKKKVISNYNKVVQGDCLNIMKGIPDKTFALIYLDPPFFTQKAQVLRTRDNKKEYQFDDTWEHIDEYKNYLKNRLIDMYRILKDNGSIFFHCDRNAIHIARILLDEIFGSDNFQAEIIWSYKRWSNSKKGLLPNHQNILFYSKSSNFIFNPVFVPYSESTNVDQILQQRKRDSNGKVVYSRNSNGEIVSSEPKNGVPLGDVWDIPFLNPKAKERVGYPTQKPILLLERILAISSSENDLILDPFCGSGTTLVAAKLMKRNFLGIDISKSAFELSQTRLDHPIKSSSNLLENGRESYLNADKAAIAHLSALDFVEVQRNNGIDALLKRNYHGTPILIRVQREYETITEAAQKLYNASKTKNSELMLLIKTQDNPELLLGNTIPEGVKILNSVSYQLSEVLTEEKII